MPGPVQASPRRGRRPAGTLQGLLHGKPRSVIPILRWILQNASVKGAFSCKAHYGTMDGMDVSVQRTWRIVAILLATLVIGYVAALFLRGGSTALAGPPLRCPGPTVECANGDCANQEACRKRRLQRRLPGELCEENSGVTNPHTSSFVPCPLSLVLRPSSFVPCP
jgi:hypothetical protein